MKSVAALPFLAVALGLPPSATASHLCVGLAGVVTGSLVTEPCTYQANHNCLTAGVDAQRVVVCVPTLVDLPPAG